MHIFLVSAYKSQDFAQSQKIFAWSHDRETVTFRNSGLEVSRRADINEQDQGKNHWKMNQYHEEEKQ